MSLDEIKELDALVGRISFKVEIEDKPKKQVSKPIIAKKAKDADYYREYYAKKTGKTVDQLKEKVHYDYEELKRIVREAVHTGRTLSKSEINYRIDVYKPGGKKVSKRVVDRVLDELIAAGEISKVPHGNFHQYKSNRSNHLDELFGMVVKGSVDDADFYSMEKIYEKIGPQNYHYDVPRGYRSYHETAAWPAGGGW